MDTQQTPDIRQATPSEVHDLKAKQMEDTAKLHRRAAALLEHQPELREFLELLRSGIWNS